MEQLTLKQWRKVKDLSQQQMADAIGKHVNIYARWEARPYEAISLEYADKIAAALGEPRDVIFPSKVCN